MDLDERRLASSTLLGILGNGQDIATNLIEYGWVELLAVDRLAAYELLFEAHGKALATSRALDLVAFEALGIPWAADVCWVHPGLERGDRFIAVEREGNRISVDGLVMAGSMTPTRLAMVMHQADKLCVAFVSAAELLDHFGGFDPTLGLARVNGKGLSILEIMPVEENAFDRCAAACQFSLAYELLGVALLLQQLAIDHVRTREQFGRPLGALQAVKHQVADMVVATTGARDVLDAIAQEAAGEIPFHSASRLAKAIAGQAAISVASCAQHLCGGLGFTEEFSLPRALRRAHALDVVWGSSHLLKAEFGSEIVREKQFRRPFML
jgi:hypothetical protein